MKSPRQLVIGLVCVLIGGSSAWRALSEGPWHLVLGGAVLVVSGLVYCVRPRRWLLGLIEIAWGAVVIINAWVDGGFLNFSSAVDAGGSCAVLLAFGLVIVGVYNVLRSFYKPKTPPPLPNP